MGRYICAIFIASLPIACFFYYLYIVCIACNEDGEKLIKEINSPTYFISSCFVIGISFAVSLICAGEIWDSQKNCNVPKTYYIEAELIAKDTTTVFKVTDNGNNDNKINYYETDIDLNIADNENKNNYMLLMSDNTTREDKSDDIILAVYNTVGEIENK